MDYHRQKDFLSRGRILGLCGGFLLAGALGAWIVAGNTFHSSKRAQYLASPGKLSSVHSDLNYECATCHVPFHPVNDETAASWVASVYRPAKDWSADSMDQNCRKCHADIGEHDIHASNPDGIGHCATCHQEHQGENFDVAATTDQMCTNCHANLQEHFSRAGTSQELPECEFSIVTFKSGERGSHPEFDVVDDDKDGGRLKFNHAQHLRTGIPVLNKETDLASQTGVVKLSSISTEYRDKYSTDIDGSPIDSDALVKLQCSHCHEADRAPDGSSESRSSVIGDGYMLPVTFEEHCRACHEPEVPVAPPQGQSGPEGKGKKVTIPHGQQPWQLRDFIQDALIANYARSKPNDSPGGVLDPSNEDTEQERILLTEYVDSRKQVIWSVLFGQKAGCIECHHIEVQEAGRGWVDEPSEELVAHLTDAEDLEGLRIVSPQVPEIWMPRARFDHLAHRNVGRSQGQELLDSFSDSEQSCSRCHADAWSSQTSETLMLPSIQICQECHTPLDIHRPETGVAWNCNECHGYHGDHHTPAQKKLSDLESRTTDNIIPLR